MSICLLFPRRTLTLLLGCCFVVGGVRGETFFSSSSTSTSTISTTPHHKNNPSIEPYPYLHGGSFSGPVVHLSPDPLVSYQWTDPSVNLSALQIFDTLPQTITLTANTPPTSFVYLESLATDNVNVSVVGEGGFMIDFGTESPAWLEFDSPDLLAADLAFISLGISEYAENAWRQGTPKAYPGNSSNSNNNLTTYRLETNPELYEGVRFGFFTISSPPSSIFHITSFRAVTQAKPVNYTGAFSATGTPDGDVLTRIWYTAAYTVRSNLEEDYIGAVLIDRGDRVAWVGDLFVAESASMTAFGNFDFVKLNIQNTADNCNSIETYCLYWVLSLCEYFKATNDTATVLSYVDTVNAKLEHAYAIYANPSSLSFVGWDDRLGNGFFNGSTVESQWVYRFLSLRSWNTWSQVMSELNEPTIAAHFTQYYTAAIQALRQANPTWYTLLGVHAAADAANAGGFLNTQEEAAISTTILNDVTTICSLSNFNQYFIAQGLANVGALDRAIASVIQCWGNEIALGGTTFWEVSMPDWSTFLREWEGVPYSYNGYTSLCHPWSAGPTPFLTRFMLGVQPLESGYNTVVIKPHITAMGMVLEGKVPMLNGVIGVAVRSRRRVENEQNRHGGNTDSFASEIVISIPERVKAGVSLELSEILLTRMGWLRTSSLVLRDDEEEEVGVEVEELAEVQLVLTTTILNIADTQEIVLSALEWASPDIAKGPRWESSRCSSMGKNKKEQEETTPMINSTQRRAPKCDARSSVLVLRLEQPGAVYTLRRLNASNEKEDKVWNDNNNHDGGGATSPLQHKAVVQEESTRSSVPPPLTSPPPVAAAFSPSVSMFPPASYPARVIAIDTWTQGQWVGEYGAAGYSLFAFENGTEDVSQLPSFISSVVSVGSTRTNWVQPPPVNDTRALQNPVKGQPAAIGCLFGTFTTAVDIYTTGQMSSWYQVAVYMVDYDYGINTHQNYPPRRQTVTVMDRETLNPITPIQYTDNFVGGVWMVFQYNQSMRIRVSQLPGDNAVVSAVAFDLV